MKYLNEYIETIKRNTSDPPGFNEEVYEDTVAQAVRIYSRYKPNYGVVDVTGTSNGVFDIPLPSNFVAGISGVISIEYPFSTTVQVPQLMHESGYRLYRSPTEVTIRLLSSKINLSETARITYSSPHTVTTGSSTIPDSHEDAIANLATSLFSEIVAAEFANISRSSMDDVAIDFREKSFQWQLVSDRYMTLFRKDLGIRENQEVDAASGWTDLSSGYSWGAEYIAHPNSWR